MNYDGPFAALFAAVVFVLGFLIGSVVEEEVTKNKCRKAGALIINNKVYECRVADVVSKQQNQERQEEQ